MESIIAQLGGPLVAVLVPLAVGLFKKVLPDIPTVVLPILAVVLGPLFDLGISYVAGIEASGVAAALYGLAGIGLRELKDQVGKAITENRPA